MLAFINLSRMLALQLQIYFRIMKDNVMPPVLIYHAMKAYGGEKVKIHTFLTVLLDGGE